MIRKLIAAAATLLALCASASADQEHPKLKAEATVTGGIVRIGDLVEHAGIVAKVPIFRAPDLGSTGMVSAEAVVEAVRPYALVGLDTGDVSEVVVTRASRTIPAKDIEARVAQVRQLGVAEDTHGAQLATSSRVEVKPGLLAHGSRRGRCRRSAR